MRILDGATATGTITRVLIDATDGSRTWTTIGVSPNIIEASWRALEKAYRAPARPLTPLARFDAEQHAGERWPWRLRAAGWGTRTAPLLEKQEAVVAWYVAVIIILVILAVPAVIIARLAPAKRRKEQVGSPSTFTRPQDESTGSTRLSPALPTVRRVILSR